MPSMCCCGGGDRGKSPVETFGDLNSSGTSSKVKSNASVNTASTGYHTPQSDEHDEMIFDRVQELVSGKVVHIVKDGELVGPLKFTVDLDRLEYVFGDYKTVPFDGKTATIDVLPLEKYDGDIALCKDYQSRHCFVLVSRLDKFTPIFVHTTDRESRDQCVEVVHFLKYFLANTGRNHKQNIWFIKGDKNQDGGLNFDEVLQLLHLLNLDVTLKNNAIKSLFHESDKRKAGVNEEDVLDSDEFNDFFYKLTLRNDLFAIFEVFSDKAEHMTIQQVKNFLSLIQKQAPASFKDAERIITLYEDNVHLKAKRLLSKEGFRNFMISHENFIMNPDHGKVYQDMSHPITHYFVATSHNTYLKADQLYGNSSLRQYERVLKTGCRCIELDCWDGPDDNPIVYHGHTLTSKLSFKDCIITINDYAFFTSPYPLILSIENHCSIGQQITMAEHMTTIFDNKLWLPNKRNDPVAIPTPEALKYKIIIKNRKLPPEQYPKRYGDVTAEDEALEIPNIESDRLWEELKKNGIKGVQGLEGFHDDENAARLSTIKHAGINLSMELSTITTLKSENFVDDYLRQVDHTFTSFSFAESRFRNLAKSRPRDFIRWSQRKIVRIYPNSKRVDSSNPTPMPFWVNGCQCVALNYQTPGMPMQLNHGKFIDNGSCGYVLKPDILMNRTLFDIASEPLNQDSVKSIITFEIISGHLIPKPDNDEKGEIIDPYVKINVVGVPKDKSEFKTKYVNNNGLNPAWGETCTFRLRVPELALLLFRVIDKDTFTADDFIGYYCLPFNSIQEGYRHIPMYNKRGVKLKQTLIFVKIRISEPNKILGGSGGASDRASKSTGI